MKPWLRRLLIAVGVLVVLVVGAAVLVPMLVPVDAYKSRIEAAVRDATGRSFEIRGPMSFSVLPSFAFQAEQAVLGNAPGATAPQMVAIKRLEVTVALLPLLSSRIEVTRLVLTEPDIALEIARDGRPNWDMGAAARPSAGPVPAQPAPPQPAPPQSAPTQPAPTQPAPMAAPRDPLAGIPDVGLGDVRIVNGHFTFSDQRNNAREEFTGVNLRLDARGLDQPVSAQGDMTWNAERMTLELTTPAPRSLLGGTPGQVQVRIQSAPVNLDANLAVNLAEPLRTTGTVVLAIASPQRLARWVGPLFPADPAPLADIGAANLRITISTGNELAVAGDVQFRDEKLEFALEGVSFAALLANRPTPVRLRANGVAGAALRLEGNAQAAPQPALSGTFNLTAPSLARLAALAGRADALAAIPGRDITAVTLEGRLGNATEVNAQGRATINGQVLQLTFESGPLSQFGNARIPLQLRVQGAPLTLAFNGQVDRATANRPPPAAGTLELTVPSVRAFAAWAGRPLADTLAPGQLNALSFQGRVAAEPTRLTITDARFSLDQLRGSGTLEAAVGGARPRLAGRLAFDRLDLNPYMAGARPAGGGGAAPAAPAAPAGNPAAGNQPPPAPPAAPQAARAGWDDTPIDTSALRVADLDLNVALAGLAAPTIELGRTALRVQLNDGQLDTQISEMALYRGQARGSLRLDARQVLGVQSQMELTGVQALPLLRALAGMEKLEGTITATWTLRANGRSQHALVQALDGQARMRVTDGALVGVNLAALVRSVGALGLDSSARETQRTDFSDLSASFAIQNGVATTQDMAMNSPLMRVQGRGTVNLPQRAVDMMLDTRLVATLQGQGGRDARGFTVPVHVSGPFDNLSYRPDLSGISREELQELTRNPGELLRNPGEALRNLIPGRQQQPQPPAQSDQQQPPQPQQPQQRQLPNLPFRIPGLGR